MKRTILLPVFLLIIAGMSFTSCETKDYDEIAEEVCDCMTEMVELDKQYRAEEGAGNIGESLALSPEFQSTSEDAEECLLEVAEEYGLENVYDDAQLAEALQEECSQTVEVINAFRE